VIHSELASHEHGTAMDCRRLRWHRISAVMSCSRCFRSTPQKRIIGGMARRSQTVLLIFLIMVLCYTGAGSAQTTFLPTSHWVYDFLDRLETRGLLPRLLGDTRPMTRLAIARELLPLLSRLEELSRAEGEQIEFLKSELREEFGQLGVEFTGQSTGWSRLVRHGLVDPWAPDLLYANGRNMLDFSLPLPGESTPPLRIWIDPVLNFDGLAASADTLTSTERVNHLERGIALRGSLGNYIGFYSDARDNQEWGTRRYPGIVNFTREGLGFVRGSGSGKQMDYDETVAGIVYSRDWLTLHMGKDRNHWGPGYAGQLMLSDHPTSYDQIKVEVAASRLRFTMLWAVLQHYNTRYFTGNHQEKYLAAHRLEFSPWPFLAVALHEMILYSGRSFEPSYLNPLNFFRSAEHYLGDRDNAAMGLDFQLKVLPKTKLYMELLLDDVTSSKLGSGFYGNKYAILTGGHHVDLFGVSGLDLRGEYTRIRPYTYTHDGVTNFQHYSTNLGHRLGPNAEGIFVQMEYRYNRPLLLKAAWERTRHGSNPAGINVGGSLYEARNHLLDSEYVDFLEGDLETANSLKLAVSYEFLRNGFVQLYFCHDAATWESASKMDYPGRRSEFGVSVELNE